MSVWHGVPPSPLLRWRGRHHREPDAGLRRGLVEPIEDAPARSLESTDLEAQAVSQWAAAELLIAEGDGAKALDWVAQARVRFERLGDTLVFTPAGKAIPLGQVAKIKRVVGPSEITSEPVLRRPRPATSYTPPPEQLVPSPSRPDTPT